MTNIDLVAIVVDAYDPAIEFFVDVLGFELVEDSPSTTNDGRPSWCSRTSPGTAGTSWGRQLTPASQPA